MTVKQPPHRRRLLCTLAGAALTLSTMSALAQDVKERTLRFAFSLAKDHPLGVGAQKFADLVAAKSGNRMKVSLFPNAVLGGDPQNLSAVRGGTLDFTSMATGLLAGIDKEFMLFDFRFSSTMRRRPMRWPMARWAPACSPSCPTAG